MAVSWLDAPDPAKRVSAAHVLAVLQALHSCGVDVVSAGPADEQSVLHAAAIADAPALVRWLATAAGAPLEVTGRENFVPAAAVCMRRQSLGSRAHVVGLRRPRGRAERETNRERGPWYWWLR
jgi:esterase/lipase superfamily enzyme